MADVLLFHHANGLTSGIEALARRLRSAGHRVTTPDLYEGEVFSSLDDGVAHAQSIGFDTVIERGVAAAAAVEGPYVTMGLSLGVLPAQKLAQTDAAVTGAVLCHGAVPVATFGDGWPDGVGLQIHLVEDDPFVAEDLGAAEELATADGAELHLYPGSGHLVTDQTSADWDPDTAGRILDRIERFLDHRR
ncbi:MAG: dienelactone hydrolase family protein [Actinomycetota bacterium]